MLNKCNKIFNKLLLFNNVIRTRFLTTVANESLANYLKMKINMKGPITVQEYIKECLGHPKYVTFFCCFILFYRFNWNGKNKRVTT